MRTLLALSLLVLGCEVPPEVEQFRASGGGDPVQLDAGGGAQVPDTRQPDSAPVQSDASAPDTSPLGPDAQQADGGAADALMPSPDAQQPDTGPKPIQVPGVDASQAYSMCPAYERTVEACKAVDYWKGFAVYYSRIKDGYVCATCRNVCRTDAGDSVACDTVEPSVPARLIGCTVAGPYLCVADCNECPVAAHR